MVVKVRVGDLVLEEDACVCNEDAIIEFYSEKELEEYSRIFKALANPIRLQIVKTLLSSPQCVCVLSAVVKKDQTLVSHHLAKLREANIVREDVVGKFRIYSLVDEKVKKIIEALDEGG